ncbi:restriction endonuclease [Streptomyces sp. NPDC058430]|uniref:restriction endonuclease n=1 Tax=Streptomyces sp. NPDC058430 TaxID=3346495 RepID=UPI003664A64F
MLQQVNGTARQVHGADTAVVLTNGHFSSKAISWGREHRIHLVDRRVLGEWAAGYALCGICSIASHRRAARRHCPDQREELAQ